jgi:glutamine amidotransferase
MCRIAAYIGPSIPLENIVVKPSHSLIEQSQHASEAKLAVNGDGFGIAWYAEDAKPGTYRDVLPAWSDGNLTSLCRIVKSHLFLAHIRASTMGETSRANCHPFSSENWSFCHNGQVPHFPQIRRWLEAALPDDLYEIRRGTTDSEMVFLTLLANGLNEDPQAAFEKTLQIIGTGDAPVKLTCVLCDGNALYGFRHASRGTAPTLYVSDVLDSGGRSMASEPLCTTADRWTLIPEDTLYRLDAGVDQSWSIAA